MVTATGKDEMPKAVMRNALVKAGLAKPDEQLSPAEITRRLQERGYDGVEVRQSEFNHGIAGSQLVVFDPKKVEPK